MRIIWLLPSLISSLVFAISTGHASYLLFAVSSIVIGVLLAVFSRQKRSESIEYRELVKFDGRWYLGGDRVSRVRAFLQPGFRRELLSHLQSRTREPDWVSAASILKEPNHTESPRLGISVSDLGRTGRLKVLELPWQANPHTLVIGPTGSGKTVLLMRILADCLRIPGVRLWFFDYKSSESAALAEAAKSAKGSLKFNASALASDFDGLWVELFAHLKWIEKRPNEHSRVSDVVIVDELAAALEHAESRGRILQLASQGRSAGVRLICASQSTAGIPRLLLANLMNRILVGEPDQAEFLMLGSRSESLKAANSRQLSQQPPRLAGWLAAKLVEPATNFVFPLKT